MAFDKKKDEFGIYEYEGNRFYDPYIASETGLDHWRESCSHKHKPGDGWGSGLSLEDQVLLAVIEQENFGAHVHSGDFYKVKDQGISTPSIQRELDKLERKGYIYKTERLVGR